MSVKQWINRIKNINSYLPLMQPNRQSFSEEHLIAEVISKNIPAAWVKDFKMFKLHLKTSIKGILSELTVIEDRLKLTQRAIKTTLTRNISRTPAEFMELMNGTNVVKIPKITRTTTKIRRIMIETKLNLIIVPEYTDVLKKIIAVSPELLTIIMTMLKKLVMMIMNTIVSPSKLIKQIHQVLRFSSLYQTKQVRKNIPLISDLLILAPQDLL